MQEYDANNDGKVDLEDLELIRQIKDIEAKTKKEQTQRHIIWGIFIIIAIMAVGSLLLAFYGLTIDNFTWIVPLMLALVPAAIAPMMNVSLNPMTYLRTSTPKVEEPLPPQIAEEDEPAEAPADGKFK